MSIPKLDILSNDRNNYTYENNSLSASNNRNRVLQCDRKIVKLIIDIDRNLWPPIDIDRNQRPMLIPRYGLRYAGEFWIIPQTSNFILRTRMAYITSEEMRFFQYERLYQHRFD